jgi:hypothetical protein
MTAGKSPVVVLDGGTHSLFSQGLTLVQSDQCPSHRTVVGEEKLADGFNSVSHVRVSRVGEPVIVDIALVVNSYFAGSSIYFCCHTGSL